MSPKYVTDSSKRGKSNTVLRGKTKMTNENITAANAALNSGSDLEGKWLTFWLDGQLYSLSILNVEQIVSMQPITEMPEYPAYAKGIINLRGNIIPLIDLRLRLGKKEAEYNDHTCVIINKVQGSMIGFIVDEVDAVVDITADIVSKPPRMDDRSESYLIGVARLPDNGKEKIVLCLDGTRVLKNDELDMLISANA